MGAKSMTLDTWIWIFTCNAQFSFRWMARNRGLVGAGCLLMLLLLCAVCPRTSAEQRGTASPVLACVVAHMEEQCSTQLSLLRRGSNRIDTKVAAGKDCHI